MSTLSSMALLDYFLTSQNSMQQNSLLAANMLLNRQQQSQSRFMTSSPPFTTPQLLTSSYGGCGDPLLSMMGGTHAGGSLNSALASMGSQCNSVPPTHLTNASHLHPSIPPQLLMNPSHLPPHFLSNPAAAMCSALLYPHRSKRIRTAFTPAQLAKLETQFARSPYVVGHQRRQISEELGLTETQVKVWFQNRRTKEKRVLHPEDESILEQESDDECPLTDDDEKSSNTQKPCETNKPISISNKKQETEKKNMNENEQKKFSALEELLNNSANKELDVEGKLSVNDLEKIAESKFLGCSSEKCSV